jgi:voltage-gated sodium channel
MNFLFIFTAELVLEFLAQGPRKYFASGWNIFDVIVVGLSYIAVNPAIAALRTLRVIRVFRLVSAVPQMRRVVEALFGAMPGILASFAILAVVFYIAAVMGTTLFHEDDGFSDLGRSLFSLFALSQFDGWGEIIDRLQEQYPYAWVYVVGFTIVASFAVLNLFIGVIVEAVQAAPQEEIMEDLEDVQEDVEEIAEAQEDAAIVQQRILEEVRALRAEIAALRGAPPPSG